MTRVAFWFDAPIEYSGGLNYIKNLLFAVAQVNRGQVEPFVFFAHDVPERIVQEFARYATVVRTRLLQRRTPAWFVHKVGNRLFGSMALVTALLKRHRIDVVSHIWFEYGGAVPFRLISWIPDFQYLHLPELFPLDPEAETARLRAIIVRSDANILSSHCALADFERIAPPGCAARAKVIQFVSQPRAAGAVTLEQVRARHGIEGPYFFLPNQFWAHKNHMVVLEAVAALQRQGLDVQVVCTGTLVDYRYRDTPYIDSIRAFMAEHGLEHHIRILGLIDYDDVLVLMKHALAVLNPSRFEGWSSSVEEAKSAGKRVLLSNIDVHLEQAPARGQYFAPDDAEALAGLMAAVWREGEEAAEGPAYQEAQAALRARTAAYGQSYLDLLAEVMRAPRLAG